MAITPLRIGVWFQENHTPFGGPALVLTGTILGLYRHAERVGQPIIILLNEQGDYNWALSLTNNAESNLHKMETWTGPICFDRADACANANQSDTWRIVHHALFPSTWFANFVSLGLPYTTGSEGHKYNVWPAGVDTDFFTPADCCAKTQDYFIYFKSQRLCDLGVLLSYLFHFWFGMRGNVLTYYNYDAEMLRMAARSSKFCIMLDDTETQGLAALEIMACDCPLFVLDSTVCKHGEGTWDGATSVTNMDGRCGLKSRLADLAADFPRFIAALETFAPRAFVTEEYSFEAAARRLLKILVAGVKHQAEHHQEKDTGVDEKA